jgi:hypothetical protein
MHGTAPALRSAAIADFSSQGDLPMLGWILIFTLLSVTTAVAGTIGHAGFNPGIGASLVFGFLLVASFLTRALRNQA